MRYQPQLRDARGRRISRTPAATCIQDEIERAVEQTARRFRCSRSFVISTALAEFFGIEAARFDELDDLPAKKRSAA